MTCDEKFNEIIVICQSNQYMYSMTDEYIEVITDSDRWKITRTKHNGDWKYNLFHLNKKGKMHWHKQGKGNYNMHQIKCRLKSHDEYCKKLRGW